VSDNKDHPESTTRYELSGIEERHGIVPAWLGIVYAVMLVWMVWYTIVFWSDKG
jgi:hypothetical protein